MCCITTLLLFFVSRIAIILLWLADRPLFTAAFGNWAAGVVPVWLWTLAGGLFLPWTTLAYVFLAPGGMLGYKWIVLAVALVIDLAGHGGSYHHRHHIPIRLGF